MKRLLGLVGLTLAMGAGAALLGSCGSTGGGSAPRNDQFVLRPIGTSSNAGTLILSVDRDSVDANNADRIRVFARLLDPFQAPLAGRGVIFRASFPDVSFIDGAPIDLPDDDLPTAETLTDGSGTAAMTVRAGGTPGRLIIQAFTSNPNLNLGGAIFLNLTDVGFISGDLQLLPAEINVIDPRAGAVLEFLITGGEPFRAPNPPYVLQNGASGVGVAEMLDDGFFPVVIRYTVSGRLAGMHVFSIIDATGAAVTGTVTVEFSELMIIPESATLPSGLSQAFAITGGVPPYVCSPSGGTLNPTTIEDRGGTTTFTAGPNVGMFTLVCNDAAGQIDTAAITISPAPSPTGGVGPSPTPQPQNVATIIVQANPTSLNGVQGGTSQIRAVVLDDNNDPVSGVNVLFTVEGQSSEPTPTVPTVSPLTAVSGADGRATTILTVPAGTAPQFVDVKASARGVSGTESVAVTSQSTEPAGPPARISAALLKQGGFGDNNDGTLITVFSALVTDAEGNPVADGVQVAWSNIVPAGAAVFTPSFTNGLPPCDVAPYESGTGLAISPQPGTALTCVVYPASFQHQLGSVRADVVGTTINRITAFTYPGGPTPTPVPTPTPEPPPTPTP